MGMLLLLVLLVRMVLLVVRMVLLVVLLVLRHLPLHPCLHQLTWTMSYKRLLHSH